MIFKKSLHYSNCKPNKIWVDKGNEFFNDLLNNFGRIMVYDIEIM